MGLCQSSGRACSIGRGEDGLNHSLRDYGIVTGAYWGFTLTDGALRMLVLLHLHELGHSPMAIAAMFLFYEVFGVITNLLGGWVGAKFGLKSTLVTGLSLQIIALSLLLVDPIGLTVPLVMTAQALSGVAKDLTKMSSKSFVKLIIPAEDHKGLMTWIAILTGSKNALKGVGFFLGGLLLTTLGFRGACLLMASLLVIPLVVGQIFLPRASGKSKAPISIRNVFSKDARLNWLSAARLFLFGSRDVWFALALPLFLSTALSWSFSEVSGFLALWVIGYGIVQAVAPRFVGRSNSGAPSAKQLGVWTAILTLPLAAILAGLQLGAPAGPTIIVGLALFGFVFAANSAIHSFLVVAYAESDKIALRVGFYYMANAMGRLVGTLLSGTIFQWAGNAESGLSACLFTSIAFVLLSACLCRPLAAAERRQMA